MTILKFKCKTCGKVFEAPYEFEGFFKEEPNPEETHISECEECVKKELERIARECPENPDLEIECRTDGSEWK